MDPLKFSVEIQGNAIEQLNEIQTKINGIKDVKMNLTVEQASGVENLVKFITDIKEAIKGGRYTEFARKINMCSEAVANLAKSFEMLNVAMPKGNNMENFKSEVQATIRDVKQTIGTLEGVKLGLSDSQTKNYIENVDKVQSAITQVQETKERLQNAMTGNNSLVANPMELTNMRELLSYLDQYEKTLYRFGSNVGTMSEKVTLVSPQDTKNILTQIDAVGALYTRIKQLQEAVPNLPKVQSWTDMLGENYSKYSGTYQEKMEAFRSALNSVQNELKEMGSSGYNITGFQEQLNALLQTYEKFASLQDIDLAKKLGLEHLKFFTGPATAVDSETWEGMKRRAEYQQYESELAEKHQRKLQELTNAFAQHDAQVAKSQRVQENENRTRQESVARLRQQAEELVHVRQEMLKNQASNLQSLLSKGKDVLGAERYEEVRTALRGVREEMREIEVVLQRIGSYSTRDLFSFGRGGMDYAPLISSTEKMVRNKEEAAKANANLLSSEQQLLMAYKAANTELSGQGQILGDLKMLAYQYLSVWGAVDFIRNIKDIGGQLEQQRMSLSAILGERSYANDLFSKVQQLAVKSPFGVVQLDQYTKNLSAFGFQYNELFDMTKRLADIAAGTGTDFGRLALAIGHVRNEMALTGYTLRQFAMANVPMLRKLSENIGVSTVEIRKMVRAKEISYMDVERVIKELTDENGMFFNMQEVMSEAVNARFKNLKDSLDIMYGQMAESGIGKVMKATASGLMEVTKRWQSFAAMLVTAGGILGVYKLGQIAINAGLKAQSANLVINTAIKKANDAATIQSLIDTKLLTPELVMQAVATGKMSTEDAKALAVKLGLNAAIIDEVAALRGLKTAAIGASSGLFTALTNPWTMALAAITAIVGAVFAYKQWSENIASNITSYIEQQKTAAKSVAEYLESVGTKPVKEGDLLSEINQMKTILKDAKLYTEELETQVGLTPNLSSEYDVLIGKLKIANSQMMDMSQHQKRLLESVKATSTTGNGFDVGYGMWEAGTSAAFFGIPFLIDFVKSGFSLKETSLAKAFDFFFNEDINQNIQDVTESLGKLRMQMSVLDEYRGKMSGAMDNMISEGHTELANKSLEDQIRILAEDEDAWERFVKLAGEGAADFEKHTDNLRKAARDVTKDWNEITDDDIPKMMRKMAEQYNMDEKTFIQWANTHKIEFGNMLNTMLANADEVAPKIGEAIRKGIFQFLRGDKIDTGLGEEQKTPDQLEAERRIKAIIEKNNKVKGYGAIGKNAMKVLVDHAKKTGLGDKNGNGFFSVDFVAKYFKSISDSGEILKNVSDNALDSISKDWKAAKQAYEYAKKVGNADEIAETKKTYERLDAAMDAFGLDKSEKKSGKSGGGSQDQMAKDLRERIKLIRDAYSWYKKYKDELKWNPHDAFLEVEEKYGEILSKLGVEWKDLGLHWDDAKGDMSGYMSSLQKLLEQAEAAYGTKSHHNSYMLDVIKELKNAIQQTNFDDIKQDMQDFTSTAEKQIEELTRKWAIFTTLLNGTGNLSLAERLSGVSAYKGQGTTVADIKALGIQQMAGKAIDFERILGMSDKDIEYYVKGLGLATEKIEGIITQLKDWKKAQQDVTKGDLDSYAKTLSGLVDYASQMARIENEYRDEIVRINRLLAAGLPQEEANKLDAVANATKNQKQWQLQSAYTNLYSNSLGMGRAELFMAYDKEIQILNENLKAGTLSQKEYNEKIANLSKIEREFGESGFLGLKGGIGSFLAGGAQGLISYYDQRAAVERNNGVKDEDNIWLQRANKLSKEQKVTEQVIKAFQDLANVTNMLGNMFDALGMEGAANAFSDAGSVLGGVASGASSLSSFGPWGAAAGAVIGGITSIAQLHDKSLQREIEAIQREISALESNTEAIKSARERTFGYDSGDYRRNIAAMYQSSIANGDYIKSLRVMGREYSFTSAAANAMSDYYARNTAGTGYDQEYQNLINERQKYMDMYDKENDKKKTSKEALEEYKQKIAELDDQIINFTQDLAKELWSIDVKGWADQISDALASAFENGENIMKAFDDAVKSIMQDVVNNILKIGVIEPMMERLQRQLFGYVDENGKKVAGAVSEEEMLNNPKSAAQKMLAEVANWMKPGGEGSNMVMAASEFMAGANDLFKQLGYANGIMNNDSANTLSASIQGMKEEQADILAGIVRAMWQDVAENRLMLGNFFEESWTDYITQITSCQTSLGNIDTNVASILALLAENGALYGYISNISSRLDDVIIGNERIHIQ